MAKKVIAEFCFPPRSQHWRDVIQQRTLPPEPRPSLIRQQLRWLRTKFF